MRQYVKHYATISAPLQNRKTEMLRKAPRKGRERREFARRTRLKDCSQAEQMSFELIQEALCQPTTLYHFVPNEQLLIDLDASKHGFGVVAYHLKDDYRNYEDSKRRPPRTAMRPILFLSRLLSSAETRYGSTEMEVACLVWTLRKLRHMIESSTKPVIFHTDHSATVDIGKQSTLSTTSTDRLNLRLVRASAYVQRFNITLKHIPGKTNTIPDTLSRLTATYPTDENVEDSELDALFAVTTSMVEMNTEFREKIINGYKGDKKIERLRQTVEENTKLEEDAANIPWRLDNDLLLHVNGYTGIERPCLPASYLREVFELVHQQHQGFQVYYDRIVSSWYVHHLARKLRSFLRHCPECQIFQTRRHKPYGQLQPIPTVAIPFWALTLDFILALPESKEGYNYAMSVTCKFSKRVTIIPGNAKFTARQWAKALLERLELADWGIPKVIISDRDRKFISELWSEVFKGLGVELLYSTAYHPQTDGQSERTNQTIETALRFQIHALNKPDLWPQILSRVQSQLNNTISKTTGKTPNELCYGLTINRPDNILTTLSTVTPNPVQARVEAKEAVDYAQTIQKHYYDQSHHPGFLKTGDWATLRLHHGYSIPSTKKVGKKLGQQYVGPFKVLERVGRQAYKLELPAHWRIHPVFTIAMLEPAPDPASDPFDRPRPDYPESVHVDGDTDHLKSWKLERILDKRMVKRGRSRTPCVEYLIRWEGYGPEEDRWYNEILLDNAKELIKDYESGFFEGRALAESTDSATEAKSTSSVVTTPIGTRSERGLPRKRGTPKKSPDPAALPESTTLPEPTSTETGTKRGRGRPRKYFSEDTFASTTDGKVS